MPVRALWASSGQAPSTVAASDCCRPPTVTSWPTRWNLGGTDPVPLRGRGNSLNCWCRRSRRLIGPSLFMSHLTRIRANIHAVGATATTASAEMLTSWETHTSGSLHAAAMVVTLSQRSPSTPWPDGECRCPITTWSSSSGWPSRHPVVSKPPTTRTLPPNSARGLGPFPPIEVGYRSRSTGRLKRIQTDPQPGDLPAQLHSILSSSASHRARRRRWTRSSGWAASMAHPGEQRSTRMTWPVTMWAVMSVPAEYGPALTEFLPPQWPSDHRDVAGCHLRAHRLHP